MVASGYVQADAAPVADLMHDSPALQSSDISHGVMFLLSTPYTVNVTELTIRPTGEKF